MLWFFYVSLAYMNTVINLFYFYTNGILIKCIILPEIVSMSIFKEASRLGNVQNIYDSTSLSNSGV